mmetsp:Transcript_73484/g.204163  ORF Transcript_73484/g.204163 Transcript_73484/m.204163 type:complete len:346 (-) Transcript_73484:110-1147(-)
MCCLDLGKHAPTRCEFLGGLPRDKTFIIAAPGEGVTPIGEFRAMGFENFALHEDVAVLPTFCTTRLPHELLRVEQEAPPESLPGPGRKSGISREATLQPSQDHWYQRPAHNEGVRLVHLPGALNGQLYCWNRHTPLLVLLLDFRRQVTTQIDEFPLWAMACYQRHALGKGLADAVGGHGQCRIIFEDQRPFHAVALNPPQHRLVREAATHGTPELMAISSVFRGSQAMLRHAEKLRPRTPSVIDPPCAISPDPKAAEAARLRVGRCPVWGRGRRRLRLLLLPIDVDHLEARARALGQRAAISRRDNFVIKLQLAADALNALAPVGPALQVYHEGLEVRPQAWDSR